MTALLEAHELACARGGRTIFADVELSAFPGDLILVRGPNGSGKSSLLKLLAGLLPFAGGELRWAGEPVEHDPAAHRARLHLVGGADALKPALTGKENLAVMRNVLAGKGSVEGALGQLGALPLRDLPARFFSTGQRRRVTLGRLLAASRPFWLLDEPETGLDAEGRSLLRQLVGAQRDEGGLVVVASHREELWSPSVLLDLG